jgi:hypothetical protein
MQFTPIRNLPQDIEARKLYWRAIEILAQPAPTPPPGYKSKETREIKDPHFAKIAAAYAQCKRYGTVNVIAVV